MDVVTVLDKSFGNLSTLTADQPTQTPRPRGDLFRPEFFEKPNRLILSTNVGIEIIEFTLALFSISVLN
jgi:hypothetical protein